MPRIRRDPVAGWSRGSRGRLAIPARARATEFSIIRWAFSFRKIFLKIFDVESQVTHPLAWKVFGVGRGGPKGGGQHHKPNRINEIRDKLQNDRALNSLLIHDYMINGRLSAHYRTCELSPCESITYEPERCAKVCLKVHKKRHIMLYSPLM